MVDEVIAGAWAKLTSKSVTYACWTHSVSRPNVMCPGDDPNCQMGWVEAAHEHGWPHRVPDPATQPWKWVKAFISGTSAYEFYIADECMGTPERPWSPDQPLAHKYLCRTSLDDQHRWPGWGDTPEAALEAAIRAWAGKEAGR